MIFDDEEYNGNPVFKVNFLDFCSVVTRKGKKTRMNIESEQLMEHIKRVKYSKKYAVDYIGIKVWNV